MVFAFVSISSLSFSISLLARLFFICLRIWQTYIDPSVFAVYMRQIHFVRAEVFLFLFSLFFHSTVLQMVLGGWWWVWLNDVYIFVLFAVLWCFFVFVYVFRVFVYVSTNARIKIELFIALFYERRFFPSLAIVLLLLAQATQFYLDVLAFTKLRTSSLCSIRLSQCICFCCVRFTKFLFLF